MNFFKKLFGKREKEYIEPDYDDDELVADRRDVDMHNTGQRSRYVMKCLEQMEEGSRELELLTGEYQLVTDYLTDIEEVEALPKEEHEKLENIANHLIGYEDQVRRYHEKKNRMNDIDFYTLRRQEDQVEEGIGKIREAEKYAVLVKKDLRRLDGERTAHEFRRKELDVGMRTHKGMVTIFVCAYVFVMFMLLVFQFAFSMEVFIGYILATAIVAIACTIVALRYMDEGKEKEKVAAEINKLIQLQNTVKIRYVNNRKLLEYLYLKYHVESGDKLEKLWKIYQHEKEERRQFTEAEAQNEYFRAEFIKTLRLYHVRYPDRWSMQIKAILDKKEMVEIRHDLILRRQTIREQMEKNKKLAESARDEIKDIANEYPQYAKEILELVDSRE